MPSQTIRYSFTTLDTEARQRIWTETRRTDTTKLYTRWTSAMLVTSWMMKCTASCLSPPHIFPHLVIATTDDRFSQGSTFEAGRPVDGYLRFLPFRIGIGSSLPVLHFGQAEGAQPGERGRTGLVWRPAGILQGRSRRRCLVGLWHCQTAHHRQKRRGEGDAHQNLACRCHPVVWF